MAHRLTSFLFPRPMILSRLRPIRASVISAVVVLMLVCLQSQSMAQPDRPLPREEMRERINTIMIAKMDEYLDLSVEQADQFFPRFRHFSNRREELEQERRELIEELSTVEKSDPTYEREIEEFLDRIHGVDMSMVELKRQFREEVRPILDPAQRARLVIFSHQFPERVRQLIDDIRRERMEQNRMNQPRRHQNPPSQGR